MGGSQSSQPGTNAAGLASAAAAHAANASVLMGNLAKMMATVQPGCPPGATATAVGGAAGGPPKTFFGGADPAQADPVKELREYAETVSARAKEELLRRLARALARAGVSVDPEGDLDNIPEQILASVPNPSKGKAFSADGAAQAKVCRIIADALNDEFSPGASKAEDRFIDTSLGPQLVCQQVGEWAHTFAAGVNTEFLAVQVSVRNALKSVQILGQIMREAWDKIQAGIEKAGDPELSRTSEPFAEIYRRAQSELQRQTDLLNNILHARLAPAAKELEIALRDESSQNALIKKLGLKPGTSEFGQALAWAFTSLGTAATVAARVHKALKAVGLSVGDYLDSPDFKALQAKFDAKVESGELKDSASLAKFLESVQVLLGAFSGRAEPEFVKALKEGAVGGAADEEKTPIAKRLDRLNAEKRIIVRDFVSRIARHYDELLAAVKEIGPALGGKIPLTDKTDLLRDALASLDSIRNDSQRIEYALIGMYVDGDARERKERFMSTLRIVSGACADIMELEMYQPVSSYFARLRAAIDAVVKTIDSFADIITKKFGGQALAEEGDVTGGAADDLPNISRSGLSLRESVAQFSYYYYVARIRANLAQTGKELEGYGEEYVDLLGDACAQRIRALAAGLEKFEKEFSDANKARILASLAGIASPAGPPAAPADAKDAWWAGLKKWVSDEFKVKMEFYQVLQAIDLYLKAFTEAIVKDPDSMKDIKTILNGVEVITRWFNEQTGDSLCRAFDAMGSVQYDGTREAVATCGQAVGADNSPDHYYEKIGRAPTAQLVGVPTVGVEPGEAGGKGRAQEVKSSVSEMYDNFQALKNLVNAFVRIGDTFGGRDLRNQVFLKPADIYNKLVRYLKYSALSVNYGADLGATTLADLPSSGPVTDYPTQCPNAVRPYQVYFGMAGAAGNPAGNYVVEDRYFTLIIKAMAAKILTAIGVFDMFERVTPLYELTPTRMIVGGSFDAEPEVIEGAAELYFRLPRLAEFYRMLFRWDGETGESLKIALIPELEGIFTGLIKLVFLKAAAPDTGDYSDSEMKTLIREVNAIYEHYRSAAPDRACQAALQAFVVEFNRRYGVVKKEDAQEYMKLVRMQRKGDYGQVNETNYSILPEEDESNSSVPRRAPSDRFIPSGAGRDVDLLAGRTQLDSSWDGSGHRAMLRNFRRRIESEFDAVFQKGEVFGKTSFSLLIKQAEVEIKRASSSAAKYAVAVKLIQGTSVVGSDANKSFMFHETVVVGLNLLGGIHAMLANFKDTIAAQSPRTITDLIMDSIYGGRLAISAARRGAVAAAAAAGAGAVPAATFTKAILIAGIDALNSEKNVGGRQHDYIIAETAGRFMGRIPEVGALSAADVYVFVEQEIDMSVASGLVLPSAPSALWGQEASVPLAALRLLNALRLAARLLTDYKAAMIDYVENVFALTSNAQGLVEVRVGRGEQPIQLNFSKLRSAVDSLMADTKYFFELFRPYIEAPVAERYETQTGSIYWLEKNLIDVYMRDDDNGDSSRTVEGISRKVSSIYKELIGDTQVRFDILDAASFTSTAPVARGTVTNYAAAATADTERYLHEHYGQALSALVFYDAVDVNSGLAVNSGAIQDSYSLGNLIATARPTAGAIERPAGTARGVYHRHALYETNARSCGLNNRSLLLSFNQALAKYLEVVADSISTPKIYLNILNTFANGVASQSVVSPAENGLIDIAIQGDSFGMRGDPKPNAILAQSLAWLLQRLTKDTNPTTQVSDHIYTTLTDAPLYVKESLRANLPGYMRLFDILTQKGEFIKQLLQKTDIDASRPSQKVIAKELRGAGPAALAAAGPGAAAIVAQAALIDAGAPMLIRAAAGVSLASSANYVPRSLSSLENLDGGQDSRAMGLRLTNLIDAISANAYALANSASEVLKELGDRPVYLQTGEGSIETYKLRYGKMPLMPLSLALWYLSDVNLSAAPGSPYFVDNKLYPMHAVGTAEFKLLYGVRQLIAGTTPVGFEQIPGVGSSLEAYNGTSAKREQVDPQRYLQFAQTAVAALRFITEARNYKPAISSSALFSAKTLFGGALVDGAAGRNTAYSLRQAAAPAHLVVSVVESSNQEDEAKNITDIVAAKTTASGTGRQTERVLNLIDMNIIPINVHALMRSIPAANLLNYEFTFDQMVASLFSEQTSRYTKPGGLTDDETKSTKQALIRLLIDPYMEISEKIRGGDNMRNALGGLVQRIYRGDNDLGLGRPKFLSDQVFNKALFRSLYPSRDGADEGGPSVGVGISRGADMAAGIAKNILDHLNEFKSKAGAIDAALSAVGWNSGADFATLTPALQRNAIAELTTSIVALEVHNAKAQELKSRVNAIDGGAATANVAAFLRRIKYVWGLVHPRIYNVNKTFAVSANNLITTTASIIAALARGATPNTADLDTFRTLIDTTPAAVATVGSPISNVAKQTMSISPLTPQYGDFDTIAAAVLLEPTLDKYQLRTYAIPQADVGRYGALTYLSKEVNAVSVGPQVKAHLERIGNMREDTRCVRNLLFITNVERVLRLKISRELTQTRNVLATSHAAVAPGITEYGFDPYGPNETYASKTYSDSRA